MLFGKCFKIIFMIFSDQNGNMAVKVEAVISQEDKGKQTGMGLKTNGPTPI